MKLEWCDFCHSRFGLAERRLEAYREGKKLKLHKHCYITFLAEQKKLLDEETTSGKIE